MSEQGGRPRARGPLPGRLLFTLAAVTALGSAAVHMLVPALPGLSRDLSVSAQAAQYTISLYLLGMAVGQLLAGPFADSAGRRPLLLAGLVLYVAGAVLGASAETLVGLTMARIVQALGAGAGLVGSRVVVGDVSGSDGAGRGQARLMGVVLLSTAVAPALGGFVYDAAGWRAILVIQAALGFAAVAAIWRLLPETLVRKVPTSGTMASPYLRLVRNPRFLRTALGIALCSCALYVLLAVAPFILIDQWGERPQSVGLYFSATAVTAITGTLLVGWLERRTDAFRVGLRLCLAGAFLSLGTSVAGLEHWAALMIPAMIITFGVGVAAPAGIAMVLRCEEGIAGTAVSAAGALQMLAGGMAPVLLGWLFAPSFLVLASIMTALVVAASLCAPPAVGVNRLGDEA
jgi:DHA1 family bicyclomycin/chloramphenicol resistance-like MFS transporter